MTVVFYSMEKAITTHTDITRSTRQSKQAVFPWMKLSAKINVWCLNRVKNTSQICFFVNFEHPDHWSQLKNVPGGVDGEGELISWTCYCSLWYQDAIRSCVSFQQPQITCEIRDLLWALATFLFIHVVSSVLSLEVRLALEVCQLYLFWVSPLWEELDTLTWELLSSSWAAKSGLSLGPSLVTCLDLKCSFRLGHKVHLMGCVKSRSIGTTLLRSVYVLTLHQLPCDPIFLYNSF